MNAKLCADKSAYIVNEYYKNNVSPYLDAMADNVIWHGPAIGQRLESLAAMREAWGNEQNALTFTLGDTEVQYIQTSPSSCEVMMMYVVTTYYPNGETLPLFQRIQFSWGDVVYTDENGRRKRIPKIFMVHISNPGEQHSDDFIYPMHFNEVYDHSAKPFQVPRISLRGSDNVFYVLALSSILWIESQPEQHSIVHLTDRALRIRDSVSVIEKQTEGKLIRVHSGFIVNPGEVRSVQRFSVTMSDGAVIPIPERKYTVIKKLLLGS